MLLHLISFSVGLILVLLCLAIILKKNKPEAKDIYLLLIMGLAGVQRLVFEVKIFIQDLVFTNPLERNLVLSMVLPVLFYLFIRNAANPGEKKQQDYLHLALSLATIILTLIFVDAIEYRAYLFSLYATTYIILIYREMYRSYTQKRNPYESKKFKTARRQLIVFTGVFTLLYLNVHYFIYSNLIAQERILLDFYAATSLIWILIFIYFLLYPVDFYGRQIVLQENISEEIKGYKIWSIKPLPSTENYVNPGYHIHEIMGLMIDYEKDMEQNLNGDQTIDSISKRINYPKNHLKHFFKHHCAYPVNKYFNSIKVKHALYLIQQGYLDKHTLESLAYQCQFNSRITFFKNFKSIVGISPTTFISRMNK